VCFWAREEEGDSASERASERDQVRLFVRRRLFPPPFSPPPPPLPLSRKDNAAGDPPRDRPLESAHCARDGPARSGARLPDAPGVREISPRVRERPSIGDGKATAEPKKRLSLFFPSSLTWCTNRSSSSGADGVMNPKPLVELNHLQTPVRRPGRSGAAVGAGAAAAAPAGAAWAPGAASAPAPGAPAAPAAASCCCCCCCAAISGADADRDAPAGSACGAGSAAAAAAGVGVAPAPCCSSCPPPPPAPPCWLERSSSCCPPWAARAPLSAAGPAWAVGTAVIAPNLAPLPPGSTPTAGGLAPED